MPQSRVAEIIKPTEVLHQLDPQDLLNYFFRLARPNFGQNAELLEQSGWQQVLIVSPYENSGRPDVTNLLTALEELRSRVALSDGFWQLCCAKFSPQNMADDYSRDRNWVVLKKPDTKSLSP